MSEVRKVSFIFDDVVYRNGKLYGIKYGKRHRHAISERRVTNHE
jgi:hypothetical protein